MPPDDDALSLHLTLERVASLFRSELRAEAARRGLKLVQLEALVYLAVANRYSDTPSALAEYLGVTKGTVSQTVAALARRGLVIRRPDARDGRVQHLKLAPEGAALARRALPLPSLARAATPEVARAAGAARTLLGLLQRARGYRTFGQCETCALFERLENGGRCGLTGERLSADDAARLCREHAPAAVI